MKQVLTDVRLFAGGADLSGASNKVELQGEAEEKDVTNYRSRGWKEVLGGLGSAQITAEGQWEAGDPGMVDDALWERLGGRAPWSVGPGEADVGALAYFTYALTSSYKLGEKVGEVAPWSGMAKSSWPPIRGRFAHPPGTARSTTGDGAAVQLGAAAAGQRLYAALHVLSVSGSTPSLTVTVESDTAEAFDDDPQTELTFDAATSAGGQILRTSGSAITGPWYRASWTISGSTPSFLFVVALGIQ